MKLLETRHFLNLRPRYNAAPSQEIAAVRRSNGGRRPSMLRWGLIPPWAKAPHIGSRLINARAETAATKSAFQAAWRARRCLIPADGFYEWSRQGAARQPWLFELKDGEPFAFAGLWERWTVREGPALTGSLREAARGEAIETCTILTIRANGIVAPIHDRMPLILDAALGPDPALGKGAAHRQQADQRPGGNGRHQVGIPGCLACAPLPDPGRRLLRVEPARGGKTALAVRVEGRRTVCLRRPVGTLDSAGGAGAHGIAPRSGARRSDRDVHNPHDQGQRDRCTDSRPHALDPAAAVVRLLACFHQRAKRHYQLLDPAARVERPGRGRSGQ